MAIVLAVVANPTFAVEPGAKPASGEVLAIKRAGGWFRALRSTVTVPNGVTQLVMERRQGAGWLPVKVQHLRFTAKEKTKVIAVVPPQGVALTEIRMVAYKGTKFPAGLTSRRHDFVRRNAANTTATGGNLTIGSGVVGIAAGGNLSLAGSDLTAKGVAPTASAAVESDIWKVTGNRLFFFNQYRGLQVFDMTQPEQPLRTGTLRMAASGEQMYVLNEDGSTVVLLGRSNAKGEVGKPAVFVVQVSNGVPSLLSEIPLPGEVIDSRLIGTKLYLLSRAPYQFTGYLRYGWSPALTLETVDLAVPAEAALLDGIPVGEGWSGALQAAGDYLLVGGTAAFPYWLADDGTLMTTGAMYFPPRPAMHLIDIATADGAPNLVKSFPLKGPVADKFKMSIVNDAAVAVTSSWSSGSWQTETWVESFPIAGGETAPLARVELTGARNERLHGTRFDGNRLYVVTFRNIDPLFVVDLADPAQPSVSGMLEIPGWSTYLEPLGDRLLAVGVESGHVTVSLFDVTDATAPGLLSRLQLGDADQSSWSEANYDEKAVEFHPEEGLMLVPYQSWKVEGGYANAMQAIEVGRDTLTAGITILHSSVARRGAVMGEHLVSISGQELLVLNRLVASAEPEAQLSLAWRVNRVVPFGNYLIEMEDGSAGFHEASNHQAMLRVARSDDPDALTEEIELGAGRIVGISRQGDRLFVAQWIPATEATQGTLRTWVLDLSAPPAVVQVGSVDHAIGHLPGEEPAALHPDWFGFRYHFPRQVEEVEGLWADASTLVWHVAAQQKPLLWYWGGPITIMPVLQPILRIGGVIGNPGVVGDPTVIIINNAAGTTLSGGLVAKPPPPKSNSNSETAFTAMLLCPVLNVAGAPAAGEVIRVTTPQTVRGASRAFASAGFVFSSFDTVTAATATSTSLNSGLFKVRRPAVFEVDSNVRSWLQVVDFNTVTPIIRPAVSIPGELLSISQADAQGAIILTNAEHRGGSARLVQASGYDGLTAFELDTHEVAVSPWNPSTSDGSHLYFARSGTTPGVIALGYDSGLAVLKELGTWTTTGMVSTLNVVDGYLLASAYGTLETATIGADGGLTAGAVFDTPANLWLNVDRAAVSDMGLWIPANDYGVEFLPWQQLAP